MWASMTGFGSVPGRRTARRSIENDPLSCERSLLRSGLRVNAEWRFERIGAGMGSVLAQHRCVNELLRRWFAVARAA